MKRLITLLLVGALLVALTFSVSAAVVEPVSPAFAYISTTIVTFKINENTGVANCCAKCITYGNETIVINGTLQQYKNGGWNDVKSWVTVGSGVGTMNKQWAVSSGYQYQFCVTFKIYNSSGSLLESHSESESYYYPGT